MAKVDEDGVGPPGDIFKFMAVRRAVLENSPLGQALPAFPQWSQILGTLYRQGTFTARHEWDDAACKTMMFYAGTFSANTTGQSIVKQYGATNVDIGIKTTVPAARLASMWMESKGLNESIRDIGGVLGVPTNPPGLPTGSSGMDLYGSFAATAAGYEKLFAGGSLPVPVKIDLATVGVWVASTGLRNMPLQQPAQYIEGLVADACLCSDAMRWAGYDPLNGPSPIVDQASIASVMKIAHEVNLGIDISTVAAATLLNSLRASMTLVGRHLSLALGEEPHARLLIKKHLKTCIDELQSPAGQKTVAYTTFAAVLQQAMLYNTMRFDRLILPSLRELSAAMHHQPLAPSAWRGLTWLVRIVQAAGRSRFAAVPSTSALAVTAWLTAALSLVRGDARTGIPQECIVQFESVGPSLAKAVRYLEAIGYSPFSRAAGLKPLQHAALRRLKIAPPLLPDSVVRRILEPLLATPMGDAIAENLSRIVDAGELTIRHDGHLQWWSIGGTCRFAMTNTHMRLIHEWLRSYASAQIALRVSPAMCTTGAIRRASIDEFERMTDVMINGSLCPWSGLGAMNRAFHDIVQLHVTYNSGGVKPNIDDLVKDGYGNGIYESVPLPGGAVGSRLSPKADVLKAKGIAADMGALVSYVESPPRFMSPLWIDTELHLPYGNQPPERSRDMRPTSEYLLLMLNLLKLYRVPPVAPMFGALGHILINARHNMTWYKFPAHRWWTSILKDKAPAAFKDITRLAAELSCQRLTFDTTGSPANIQALLAEQRAGFDPTQDPEAMALASHYYRLGHGEPEFAPSLPLAVLPVLPANPWSYSRAGCCCAAGVLMKFFGTSPWDIPLFWAGMRSLTHGVGNDEQVYPYSPRGVTDPFGHLFSDSLRHTYSPEGKSSLQQAPMPYPKIIADADLIDAIFFDDSSGAEEVYRLLAAYNQNPGEFIAKQDSKLYALAYGHVTTATDFIETTSAKAFSLFNDKQNSFPDNSTYFSTAAYLRYPPAVRRQLANSLLSVGASNQRISEVISQSIDATLRGGTFHGYDEKGEVVSTSCKFEAHKERKPREFTLPSLGVKFVLRILQESFNRGLTNLTGNTMGVSLTKLAKESAAVSLNTGTREMSKILLSTDMAAFSTMMPATVVALQLLVYSHLFPSRETMVGLSSLALCKSLWESSEALSPDLREQARAAASVRALLAVQDKIIAYGIDNGVAIMPVAFYKTTFAVPPRCVPFCDIPPSVIPEVSYVAQSIGYGWLCHRANGLQLAQMKYDGAYEGFINGVWTAYHLAIMNHAFARLNSTSNISRPIIDRKSYAVAFSDDGLLALWLNNEAAHLTPAECAQIAVAIIQTFTIEGGIELNRFKTIVCEDGYVFLNTLFRKGVIVYLPAKSCMNIFSVPTEDGTTPADLIAAVMSSWAAAHREGLDEGTCQALAGWALAEVNNNCIFPSLNPRGSNGVPSVSIEDSYRGIIEAANATRPGALAFLTVHEEASQAGDKVPSWMASPFQAQLEALGLLATAMQQQVTDPNSTVSVHPDGLEGLEEPLVYATDPLTDLATYAISTDVGEIGCTVHDDGMICVYEFAIPLQEDESLQLKDTEEAQAAQAEGMGKLDIKPLQLAQFGQGRLSAE